MGTYSLKTQLSSKASDDRRSDSRLSSLKGMELEKKHARMLANAIDNGEEELQLNYQMN